MKKVLIHSLSSDIDNFFTIGVRDNYNEPLIKLKDRLLKIGLLLETTSNQSLNDCECVLFFEVVSAYVGIKGKARKIKRKIFNQSSRDLFHECLKHGMQDKISLVLAEPPSVFPENWNLKLHKYFPKIFTWNDALIDGEKYIKVPAVPLSENYPNVSSIPYLNKRLLVNISANKLSSHPNELYSERLKSIKYFGTFHQNDFDLFGYGWNKKGRLEKNKLISYRGTVDNKWDVLYKYRFSICYENIHSEEGYITEKIFDSMRCFSIPVYWGAPNITEYVDKSTFIDRRDFSSNADLAKYLTSMTENEYLQYIESITTYLNSERFKFFLSSNWVETILNTLKLSQN